MLLLGKVLLYLNICSLLLMQFTFADEQLIEQEERGFCYLTPRKDLVIHHRGVQVNEKTVYFQHDSILVFRCPSNSNYKLIGKNVLKCTNGKWSSSAPFCQELRIRGRYSPPVIEYKVNNGVAAVAPDGTVVVKRDSNIVIKCLWFQILGTARWTKDYDSDVDLATNWNDEKNELQLRFERIQLQDEGNYVCSTSYSKSHSIKIKVLDSSIELVTEMPVASRNDKEETKFKEDHVTPQPSTNSPITVTQQRIDVCIKFLKSLNYSVLPMRGSFSDRDSSGNHESREPNTGGCSPTGSNTDGQGSTGSNLGGQGSSGPNTGGHGSSGPNTGGHGSSGPNTGGQGSSGPNTGGQGSTGPNTRGQGSTRPNTGGHGSARPNIGGHGGTDHNTGEVDFSEENFAVLPPVDNNVGSDSNEENIEQISQDKTDWRSTPKPKPAIPRIHDSNCRYEKQNDILTFLNGLEVTAVESTFKEGTELHHRCSDIGKLKFIGSETRICVDGLWTGDGPVCQRLELRSRKTPPVIAYEVQDSDSFSITEDGRLSVPLGSTVILKCLWFKQYGEPEWIYERNWKTYSEWNFEANSFNLEISNVQTSDEGRYICKTPHRKEHGITLQVRRKPTQIRFQRREK